MKNKYISVSNLIYCPYYRKHYHKVTTNMLIGIERHDEILKKLEEMGYKTEYEVEYCFDNKYCIKGRIDVIDLMKARVIELKPLNSRNNYDAWELQLGMYTEMIRTKYENDFNPYFMMYRKEGNTIKLYVHRPLIIDVDIINRNKDTIKEIIDNKDNVKIAPFSCKYCPLKDKCKPDYKWIHRHYAWYLVKEK